LSLGRGWGFFSSTPCPDQLWGQPSHLSTYPMSTRGSFLVGKAAGA